MDMVFVISLSTPLSRKEKGGVFLRRVKASSVTMTVPGKTAVWLFRHPLGLSRAFLTTLFISSCIRGLIIKSQAPALIASTAVTSDA